MNIEFCSCPDEYCCSMLTNNYAGQILDIRKVMETPCDTRNRILSFTTTTPTMRSVEKSEQAVFLDNRELFLCNCLKNNNRKQCACCPITVRIPVEISMENDPAMSTTVQGVIHDMDEQGCTFHSDADIGPGSFIYLKIPTLRNSLPIFAGVSNGKKNCTCSCGYRVRFLNIKTDQIDQLRENIIE